MLYIDQQPVSFQFLSNLLIPVGTSVVMFRPILYFDMLVQLDTPFLAGSGYYKNRMSSTCT